MFSQIRIQGFRRIEDVTINFKKPNLSVMIGANGVGKTSVMDAVSLLSESASGKLVPTLSNLGGINSILTRGRADELKFGASMAVSGYEPLEYSLSLIAQGSGHEIKFEQLSQDRGFHDPFLHIIANQGRVRFHDGKNLSPPNWEHDIKETSLSQVPKMYAQPEGFRKVVSTAALYHTLDVSARAPVKLPQPMKPAESPGVNGEDLVSFLYNLREADRDRYETITDSLKAAFPTFDELNFPPVAAGTLAMTWKDKNFTKPIFMHELSEGTLRFTWLCALLQSPTLPSVTMLDEPEVSLHPELLSILAELMREASNKTQLIVATHSDRLVRFLKPEEVIVMDSNEEGATTINWADEMPNLEDWLSEYSLDDIWRMGRMGGRS
jgi:predicted ATPase